MKKRNWLVFVASALCLTGCVEEEEGPTQDDFDIVKDEKEILSQKLEKAYLELDDYDLKFEEFQSLQEKAKAAESTEELLKQEQEAKEEAEEELRKVREEFDAYQKKYEAKVRRAGVGEEFASLEVTGRELKAVVIDSISETELKVRHADGFATLTSTTAPQDLKSRFFLRSEDEIAERAAALEELLNPVPEVPAETVLRGREPSEYQLRREERTRQFEAVQAMGPEIGAALVTIEAGGGSGTGFFAQDGITTFLYTAGSILRGSSQVRVVDAQGVEWTQFGGVQSAKGCDLVRIVVTEPVGSILTIRKPGQEELVPGATVAAFGKPTSSGELVKGVSNLRKVTPEAYECSPSALSNAAGGPLVDGNGEVIALVTVPPAEKEGVWGAEKSRSRSARYQVCRLDASVQWDAPAPLTSFLSAGQAIVDYDRVTRLLFAVAALELTDEGFSLDARVGGSQSIKDVLAENKQLNVVSQIFRTNEEMTSRKMKVSERDKNRKLRSLFQTVGNGAAKQALPLEALPTYYRPRAELSLAARKEASDALAQRIERLQH